MLHEKLFAAQGEVLMQLVRDYVQRFDALWDEPGQCQIRVFRAEGQPTVMVCTELPGNQNAGMTIMSIVGGLAKQIWQREGEPEPFIWIEHYPAGLAPGGVETFHEVTFARLPGPRFFSPQWKPMTREEVESLVGHQIE